MIRNARIASTQLGFEDHGIFTAYLCLEWEGAAQSFGGYVLVGAHTTLFLVGLLRTLDVDRWEKLSGQLVRIDSDGRRIQRIGHPLKEQWFDADNFGGVR